MPSGGGIATATGAGPNNQQEQSKDPSTEVVSGLAIYFFNYSTWKATPGVWLEELYVPPEFRRRGYAELLIRAMATEASKAGCEKIDWVCLTDNELALRYCEKTIGAKRMSDWATLRVDKAGIERLAGPGSD